MKVFIRERWLNAQKPGQSEQYDQKWKEAFGGGPVLAKRGRTLSSPLQLWVSPFSIWFSDTRERPSSLRRSPVFGRSASAQRWKTDNLIRST